MWTRALLIGRQLEWKVDSQDLVDVWVKVEMNDQRNPQHGPELSISSVVGPKPNGDAWGGSGQCRDLNIVSYADGWDADMVASLLAIWERWHLNGMQAGSPAQRQWLRDNPAEFPGYPIDHYSWTKARLVAAGLQPDPDTGYSYGSSWLYEPVPNDVITWLRGLPVAPKACPWDSIRDFTRPDQEATS